jgi:hypothetical protein
VALRGMAWGPSTSLGRCAAPLPWPRADEGPLIPRHGTHNEAESQGHHRRDAWGNPRDFPVDRPLPGLSYWATGVIGGIRRGNGEVQAHGPGTTAPHDIGDILQEGLDGDATAVGFAEPEDQKK